MKLENICLEGFQTLEYFSKFLKNEQISIKNKNNFLIYYHKKMREKYYFPT